MSELTHGTISGYRNHHCHCDDCKKAHRENVTKNRQLRMARGELSHGTRSAYDADCRCDQCRSRRAAAYAREKVANG